MRTRYFLLGAVLVLALALAVPALGGPSNPIARSALSLSKVNKTAKSAKKTATSAQSAATSAQAAASAAQATANGKQDKTRWAYYCPSCGGPSDIQAQSGGITIATVNGTGDVTLDFGSSQSNRALIATTNLNGVLGGAQVALCGGLGFTNPGGINCTPTGINDTNHVRLKTFTTTGAAANTPVYIASIP